MAISAAMSCKQLADFYQPLSQFSATQPRVPPLRRRRIFTANGVHVLRPSCVFTMARAARHHCGSTRKKDDTCARGETISRKCSRNIVLRGDMVRRFFIADASFRFDGTRVGSLVSRKKENYGCAEMTREQNPYVCYLQFLSKDRATTATHVTR